MCACVTGELACFTAVRFASAGRTFSTCQPLRALSSRCGACGPSLWHPCRLSRVCDVAHATTHPWEPPRSSMPRPRERYGARMTIRSAFHRSRTFALQRPLGRPAPAWAGHAAWPPRHRPSTPFDPRRSSQIRAGRALVHAPPLPTGSALLGASTSLADFCNLIRRAGAPDERSILARERGFHPAARRHQPMPVALAAGVRRRTAGLRAAIRTRRLSRAAFHSRGWDGWRAGALEQGEPRALGRTCPPRGAPGTRSPTRVATSPGEARGSSDRPRCTADAAPRRATPLEASRCLLSRRNPYASAGWLPRARPDRSPFTPPPRRHCSRAHAPFLPLSRRLPLTRKAPEVARSVEPGVPKSPRNGGSQRPSRLLRPKQLAGRCAANFMTRMSYESRRRATEKALEQCFFSSTRCPQCCPQIVPIHWLFSENFHGFESGIGMRIVP